LKDAPLKPRASTPSGGFTEHAGALEPPPLVFSRADTSGGSEERPEKSHRILVVEDDFLIAIEIETALSEAGFAVAGIAATAEEALEMAGSRSPTLAVMDIRLAGKKDGVDAARDLFSRHGIRCILATAHGDQEVRRRAIPARPLAWLQKPYMAASLVEAVGKALRELDDEKQ